MACAAGARSEFTHMKNIWLLEGSTGEYADFTTWIVVGYATQAEADKHRDAAQAAADSAMKLSNAQRRDFKNPHDPKCQIDYTGTRYTVQMIEVREAFQPWNAKTEQEKNDALYREFSDKPDAK